MKKIYLVHCWGGTSNDGWYPWIDRSLSNKNTKVIRFDMPNTSNPVINEWLDKLDSVIDDLDENTYFIGHSIGCQTIMRYLETKEITKIGGILFIAPWFDLLKKAVEDEESYNTAYPWINNKIDLEKVKKFTSNINCIFSDNDYFVSLEQKDEFKNKLNAETCVVKNKGHISQDDNVFELNEILDLSKKMLGE